MTATATEHPVTSPRRRVLRIIVLLVAYAVLVFFVLSALFAGATTVGKSAVTKASAATSANSVSMTYLASAAPAALAMEQSAVVAAAVAAQVGAGSLPTSAALSSLDQLHPLLQQDQRVLQAIKARERRCEDPAERSKRRRQAHPGRDNAAWRRQFGQQAGHRPGRRQPGYG